MAAADILARLGTRQAWQERGNGLWLEDPALGIVQVAQAMRQEGARLVTVTARPLPASPEGREFRLAYHWDLDGQVLSFVATTYRKCTPTITNIYPGADWIERELHDYYAIEFAGRESLPALMLRSGDQPGIFL